MIANQVHEPNAESSKAFMRIENESIPPIMDHRAMQCQQRDVSVDLDPRVRDII
jgi:hypothetical protein